MRSRGILMLFIAVIAGLAAVFLATRWMQGQGGEGGRIAVANTDIELGGRISPEMIRMADWPLGSTPTGAYKEAAKLEGRVVLVSMQRGEPLIEARLAPIGTKGGLSAVVPQGKRAMTVRVNDVVGVAGFALPGTFVDVMVNTQDEGGQRNDRDRSVSKIVLERILVLAVAQEADRDSTKPRVVNAVTLEVTPRDAEMLDLARSVGTLSLVLRNQTDPKGVAATGGATKAELLGLAKSEPAKPAVTPLAPARHVVRRVVAPAVAAAPAPSKNCVEIIRGLSKVTECF
ncbi:Flp pilus assembly CpaB [Rhodoferax ferrireducens T118]|uniref:Flp pilus assembly CpaB n=1 Tax=Albidiferax ferrireducens (strain ATCC BAA-621 / DSM 15236 / T118) TaxID=338969 RepID=Q220L1_ALBFT|nr:Flp pilus assembly protein CpaB [Rhodoferax ferrireducens]ABD68542.1 Flp pilus assembly CpaB [Rhodoferax ferrireducens T118]